MVEIGYAVGLINRLVEPGRALDEAPDLARTIAANGPLAVRVTKQVITDSRDWPTAEVFARQRAITGPVRSSEDARAFAEKRAPVRRGR